MRVMYGHHKVSAVDKLTLMGDFTPAMSLVANGSFWAANIHKQFSRTAHNTMHSDSAIHLYTFKQIQKIWRSNDLFGTEQSK